LREFRKYLEELGGLGSVAAGQEHTAILRSRAPRALREFVPLHKLRERGAFFTSNDMAEKLWAPALQGLGPSSVVVDPACGAGDLLIPPLTRLLAERPDSVPRSIRGIDVERDFVRAARTRLALLSGRSTGEFSAIVTGDFLEDDISGTLALATHVVMNPPFSMVPSPPGSEWSSGAVSAAAVFVDKALESMASGARLLAILPDVLRSGARYGRWRRSVRRRSNLVRLEDLGQFDELTDVHVFALELVREENPSWNALSLEEARVSDASRVGDFFDVRVGAVVPHRHAEVGPSLRFITARGLSSLPADPPYRRFPGRADRGPFVAVRRTSRPGERNRAKATLVDRDEDMAVENHLIVLKQRDPAAFGYGDLLDVLRSGSTTEFLDEVIRCRHLTVGAVRDVPWQ
jgi:hypothetical protein